MSPTVMMYREVFQAFIEGGLNESQAATATELLVECVEQFEDETGATDYAGMAEDAVESFVGLDFSGDEDLEAALANLTPNEDVMKKVADCMAVALVRLF